MTKPRIFIGSSVEGRSVAYAIQQNLRYDAEATVWDQGAFELSLTSIESLSDALSENDFGVFVFAPDDLTKIRNSLKSTVRDNVLFEFGLFIGRLGRQRVFFVIPADGTLHIPSDLLGITPGKYEVGRSDGNMQAATGSVSNEIRQQIKKIGIFPGRVHEDASAENSTQVSSGTVAWVMDYFDGKYNEAKAKLQEKFKDQSGDEALKYEAWMMLCDIKQSGGSMTPLIEFARTHDTIASLQASIAVILRVEGHVSRAIDLLLAAQSKWPKDVRVARELAECRVAEADNDGAITELLNVSPEDTPEVALQLAELYEGDEKQIEALRIVQKCYENNPKNEKIRFKYARLAYELKHLPIALCLLDELTREDSNSIEYWGYLGNVCLDLDLHDKALSSYRCAQALMKEDDSSQWIVANIGNLLNNKGLHTEACGYLEKAIKYEPRNEYSHDRLASTLKKRASEAKEFEKKCLEGRGQLREAKAQTAAPDPAGEDGLRGLLSALSEQSS